MCQAQRHGVRALAVEAGVTGATDVTGFGLLGHLQEMCAASGTGAALHAAEVPLLPEVTSLAAAGVRPRRDRPQPHSRRQAPPLPVRRTRRAALLNLLADPQTSGGLLLACPPGAAGDLVDALVAANHTAAVIGETTGSVPAGQIELVLES